MSLLEDRLQRSSPSSRLCILSTALAAESPETWRVVIQMSCLWTSIQHSLLLGTLTGYELLITTERNFSDPS